MVKAFIVLSALTLSGFTSIVSAASVTSPCPTGWTQHTITLPRNELIVEKKLVDIKSPMPFQICRVGDASNRPLERAGVIIAWSIGSSGDSHSEQLAPTRCLSGDATVIKTTVIKDLRDIGPPLKLDLCGSL